MKTLTPDQLGKLVLLLAENGYAVIPLTAFQGAKVAPTTTATPVHVPTPAVEAEGERKYKCSVCGEEGHNARTCPTKNAPAPAQAKPAPAAPAKVQAPAPAAPAFDLDLSLDLDLGDLGGSAPAAPAKVQAKPTPAPTPKAKPAPAPAPVQGTATKAELDAELDAIFDFG